MNLLISILNDLYSQKMASFESDRIRLKCSLIEEDEFLFRRNKVFKGNSFIVKLTVQEDNSLKQTRNLH